MKGGKQIVENGVVWGSLVDVTQGHRQWQYSTKNAYDVLFAFNSNNVSISYCLRGTASILSKVLDFHLPHLHCWRWTFAYFNRIVCSKNWTLCAVVWRCLPDPKFNTRQSWTADSAPLWGYFMSTSYYWRYIRMDITCKHDFINIQHTHCGLVGPDCKK